jgi:hypothetical protein
MKLVFPAVAYLFVFLMFEGSKRTKKIVENELKNYKKILLRKIIFLTSFFAVKSVTIFTILISKSFSIFRSVMLDNLSCLILFLK